MLQARCHAHLCNPVPQVSFNQGGLIKDADPMILTAMVAMVAGVWATWAAAAVSVASRKPKVK